ncbi:hypothetical protein [Spirosoma sordidisoli]|uniref:Copper resistance protein NlpE n=1 Tax=Spirosoma sordidisoli TaxID=2502893 RepID=A0A4Q2UVD9_9BACT|nr:hypothetical protein [Spirosoma sordidisoli]RYC71981.1 hypothetical protein EQG79_07625 [Spirosoma sordidisoli]
MKQIILLLGLAISFVGATRPSPQPSVFVASTPCDLIPRIWLGIPTDASCEFIKWTLSLSRDPRNQAPAAYLLHYTYGITQPNTTGFANGGTTRQKTGQWQQVRDAQQRTVYQLGTSPADTTIRLVKLDDNLLHLLDPQGKLMIGHAGWSYTLNKR